MKLPSSATRYGKTALLVLCGISLVLAILEMVQMAGSQSLSKWYHPDPVSYIQHPRFSPDESMIAFTVCKPCKIAICSIATQQTVLLSATNGATAYDATFDPRTSKVAFVLSRTLPNGNWDYQIAASQIDGSGLTILTSSDTQKRFPNYTLDGDKIVFEGKERCLRDPTKYCGADAYEFDFSTKQERRLTDLNTLQIGPVSFLPGNDELVLTAYGSSTPRGRRYEERVDVEKVYGKNRVFVVDIKKPSQLEQLTTGTPTASSPFALQSGAIAFLSRVNDDSVKAGYGYDVFTLGSAGSRRLTNFSGYVRDFGIASTAQSVAIVTESKEKPARAELLLWNAGGGPIRKLQCGSSVEERALVP